MHFCSQSSRYAKQGLLKVLFSHVISLLNPRDLTYLCSNVLHSNEHKLLTIITSTCFSERSANLPTFIKTYIYIVLYFTSLCNKEKYTLSKTSIFMYSPFAICFVYLPQNLGGVGADSVSNAAKNGRAKLVMDT